MHTITERFSVNGYLIVNPFTVGNPLFWENFFCQNAFETVSFEHEQSSLLELITIISQG